MDDKRFDVLGVKINAIDMPGALACIEGWLAASRPRYACLATVHGIMECQKDPGVKRAFNNSGLTLPDGMPLVWSGRISGFAKTGRVYGPDLMLEICRLSVSKGYTHFLYGGKEGVAPLLKRRLEERFPGLRIVGTCTPPFRALNDREKENLIHQVKTLCPDFFWVGLGTPRQEQFMAEYINQLRTGVMLGVGAAFDFHTGLVKEAPDWMKPLGLQWVFRLGQEPARLWRRYLYNNPVFVYKYVRQLLGRWHRPRS